MYQFDTVDMMHLIFCLPSAERNLSSRLNRLIHADFSR